MKLKDIRKKTIYFPMSMLDVLLFEAERVDRSLSWVVQSAVRHGIKAVQMLPDAPASIVEDVT